MSAVDGANALARMKRLHPGLEQEGFFLARSVAFHGPDAPSKRATGILADLCETQAGWARGRGVYETCKSG
jgi:hypothetical protein